MPRTPGKQQTKRRTKTPPVAPKKPSAPNVFDFGRMQQARARDEEGIVVSPLYDFAGSEIWEQPDGTPASITIPGPTASRARAADLRAALTRLQQKKEAEESVPPSVGTPEDLLRSIEQNQQRNAVRFAHSMIAWTLFQEGEDGEFQLVPLTPENALILFDNRPDLVQQLALAEERHKATFRRRGDGTDSARDLARADG